jgi:hypothetical protein
LGISVTDPKRSDIAFVDGPPTLPPTPPPSYDTDPSIISNGTKSPRGTDGIDGDDDDDDDENDSMSPPSVTVNDGATNNQSNSGTDPGNNIDGSYSEWITYTSPVNVQLWVRCVYIQVFFLTPLYHCLWLMACFLPLMASFLGFFHPPHPPFFRIGVDFLVYFYLSVR